LFFDLINMYSHAMETPFKITKHGSTHAELRYSCLVCDAWCTMQPVQDTMYGERYTIDDTARYTIDDSARYTIDDSARYTICLQNSTMRGVQKKLGYFGGNFWTMLFSSQKKRHTARKICELIKTTVLMACLFYYDYQLSKARRKFVEKFWRSNFGVTTGNFPCFQW